MLLFRYTKDDQCSSTFQTYERHLELLSRYNLKTVSATFQICILKTFSAMYFPDALSWHSVIHFRCSRHFQCYFLDKTFSDTSSINKPHWMLLSRCTKDIQCCTFQTYERRLILLSRYNLKTVSATFHIYWRRSVLLFRFTKDVQYCFPDVQLYIKHSVLISKCTKHIQCYTFYRCTKYV